MSAKKLYQVVVTATERAELSCVEQEFVPLLSDEIYGHTLASAISPGTELAWNYQGKQFPNYPGYAAVFEVTEVGSAVRRFKIGDRVLCMGPHCSSQRIKEHQGVLLPRVVVPEAATLARMMIVPMVTLTTTKARPGQTVLITGLGLVGHLAAQIFSQCGYKVLAVEPAEARRQLAASCGIQSVLEKVPLEDPQICGKVALVVECSGFEQAALDGCRMVRKGGEVVLVGVPWNKRSELSAFDLLTTVFHKYVVLRSGWEWELPSQAQDFRINSTFDNLATALGWIAEGRIKVESLYKKVAPADAPHIYESLLRRTFPYLSAIFDWKDLQP